MGRRPQPECLARIIPGRVQVIRLLQYVNEFSARREENGATVADVAPGVVVPIRLFMGIMAVAPSAPRMGDPGVSADGVQNSRPPGAYGGNLDLKDLGPGAKLFLPVFDPGARIYFGDPHSAQGDGEVNGSALEHSLSGRFRVTVHKGRKPLDGPRAETSTHDDGNRRRSGPSDALGDGGGCQVPGG